MITQKEFIFESRTHSLPYFAQLIKKHNLTGNEILDSQDGRTVLMLVAANCSSEGKIRILIEAGAAVDKQASNGYTALMYAAINGYEYNIRTLLKHKANPSLVNTEGKTALQLRAEYTSRQAAQNNSTGNIGYTAAYNRSPQLPTSQPQAGTNSATQAPHIQAREAAKVAAKEAIAKAKAKAKAEKNADIARAIEEALKTGRVAVEEALAAARQQNVVRQPGRVESGVPVSATVDQAAEARKSIDLAIAKANEAKAAKAQAQEAAEAARAQAKEAQTAEKAAKAQAKEAEKAARAEAKETEKAARDKAKVERDAAKVQAQEAENALALQSAVSAVEVLVFLKRGAGLVPGTNDENNNSNSNKRFKQTQS